MRAIATTVLLLLAAIAAGASDGADSKPVAAISSLTIAVSQNEAELAESAGTAAATETHFSSRPAMPPPDTKIAGGDSTPNLSSVAPSLTAASDGSPRPLKTFLGIRPVISPAVAAAGFIAPTRINAVPHRFFDKRNLTGFGIHTAVRALDATQTCILLGRGRREAWLPVKSCAGVAAYSMSMVPAQIGSSYLMHRSGHHKLERWLPYLWAAPSAAGVALSVKQW